MGDPRRLEGRIPAFRGPIIRKEGRGGEGLDLILEVPEGTIGLVAVPGEYASRRDGHFTSDANGTC